MATKRERAKKKAQTAKEAVPEVEETEKEPEVSATESIREGAKKFRELFDILVPPRNLDIEDGEGNVYKVRGSLVASKQVKLLRHFEELFDNDQSRQIWADTELSAIGISGTILSMISDEGVVEGIAEAFEMAHPRVVHQAIVTWMKEQRRLQKDVIEFDHAETDPAEPVDHEEIETPPVMDVFPIEEMVRALVPFFVRFAARLGSTLGLMMADPEAEKAA